MTTKILFTDKTISFILEALNYKVDKQGYVIDNKGEFVWDISGRKFKPDQIVAISKNEFITHIEHLLNNKI